METFRVSRVFAVALLLPLAACSSTPKEGAPYVLDSQQVTLEGSITRIDKINRVVTVRGPEGNEIQLPAGEEVRNFDQLAVGDRVSLDYRRAVAVEIEEAGTEALAASVDGGTARVQEGVKPGGAVAGVGVLVAEVMAVDTAANRVSVKGPAGNVVVLDVVREDLRKRLRTLKAGQLLRVTMEEAAAISVRPRPQ